MATLAATQENVGFVLRYSSLFNAGRALAFPCDCQGCVDMDALSDRARDNYLVARALVGRDYASPIVTLVAITTH